MPGKKLLLIVLFAIKLSIIFLLDAIKPNTVLELVIMLLKETKARQNLRVNIALKNL